MSSWDYDAIQGLIELVEHITRQRNFRNALYEYGERILTFDRI
jgi:hypothetical protein